MNTENRDYVEKVMSILRIDLLLVIWDNGRCV